MLEKTKLNEKEAGDGQFILKQLYTVPHVQRYRERERKYWEQWMWLSWLSGRFRCQRSVVRIQSSAKIYIEHLQSTVLKRKYRDRNFQESKRVKCSLLKVSNMPKPLIR